ncbi:hypothetical protein CHITON_0789 [Thermococcus chitonophagus]|uniref:Uncharacterized protein n=1 Tax=Thermococcus chitonophagus TaxID=54262 RepID=A0A161K9C9_9EURY|nr:hypothetical protein CHITON_0789 [Thermococcus chitonophagus]
MVPSKKEIDTERELMDMKVIDIKNVKRCYGGARSWVNADR